MHRRGQTDGTITQCVTHYGHTAIPVGRLLGRLNFFRRFRVLRLPFFGCLLFVYPQSTFCDVFVVVCFYRIFLLLLLLLLLVVAGRKLHVFVIVWYSQGCCCQWVCFCHSFRLRFSVFRLVFCRTVTPDPLIFSIRLGFWKGVLARNFVLRQVLWIHTEIVHTKNRYSQRTLTMRRKTEKTLTHTHTQPKTDDVENAKYRWWWRRWLLQSLSRGGTRGPVRGMVGHVGDDGGRVIGIVVDADDATTMLAMLMMLVHVWWVFLGILCWLCWTDVIEMGCFGTEWYPLMFCNILNSDRPVYTDGCSNFSQLCLGLQVSKGVT